MVENNYDKNNKIKMVYIDKANYFVPDFLAKNFENIPAPIDFYEGYSHREEIPFWWTRDVALPLTSKENRKAKKEALNILRALEMQGMQLELANKRFLLLLQKQEREHKKRCEMLNEQTNQKLEELKVLSQNNKLEYQNKLMELELELQNINMEKAFYEREKANLFHLEEQSEQLTESHLEWQEAIAAIDEEILESKERSETVKIKLHNEYKEKGLLASAPSYEKKINDEKRQKLPDTTPLSKIKLESFDKRNILEVKHLYLTSRDSGQSELLNIDFNVKKREITIVHSESERVRIGILSAIMRTLPSNIQISNGDIMLGGKSVSESLHDEYRKRIQKLLVSSLDIEDIFARSNKKLYKAFFSTKFPKRYWKTCCEYLI